MQNPKVHPAVLLAPVEEGYVAYDPAADRLHQLNPIAALLAELCDGNRSIEDVRALAAPLLPEGKGAEVDRWIDEGIKTGFLIWAGGEKDSSAAREMSVEELIALTKRLKNTGELQPAYICAKRIAELKPEMADAWYDVGEIAHSIGKRDEARTAFEKYLATNPDDGEIEHLLIALRDDAPPPRASDRAILHIYKNFASNYEVRMLDDLKYCGPDRMMEAVSAVIGERGGLNILDLGCGSGLSGRKFKPRAARLTGVDLSPDMLELARARNIYDRLELGEITQWLRDGDTPFDLILSCDCIIYFGDLAPLVSAAAARLKPGGLFSFSMERGTRMPFHLTDTGRYTHHPDHVREAAAGAGLTVAQMNEAFLRYEYGEEVQGLYAVLQKPR